MSEGGTYMATEFKRFTITIPQDVKLDLDVAKEQIYKKDTQSQMMRDLIARGLDALKTEKEAKGNSQGKIA